MYEDRTTSCQETAVIGLKYAGLEIGDNIKKWIHLHDLGTWSFIYLIYKFKPLVTIAFPLLQCLSDFSNKCLKHNLNILQALPKAVM
jgi:hypothetical protein